MDNKFELDKDYIKNKIQKILNNTHNNPNKREIKEFHDRLNFACPICGDSNKVSTKKRGNLYFKNLMFKCFNNGCHMSFIKLCKEFNVDIDIEDRLNLYNYIDNNTYYTPENDDFVLSSLNRLIEIDKLVDFYNTHPEFKILNIKPIQKNSVVHQYLLLNRNITQYDNLYQAEFKHSDKWIEPVVLILNKHKSLILGMQIRNLKEDKNKRFYKIYDFGMIYNDMFPNEQLDEFELLNYNKLSHFFNILNVDFSKPVTIFEGYFDSYFFPNSIGVIGTNTDLTFLLKDDSLDIRFFYDNDKAGYNEAIKQLNNGYKVFLWRLLFKNILKNKPDKYSAQFRLLKIKDLNKLAVETKKSPYQLLSLEDYFSKDEFDKIYLDYKTPLINLL
jgi:hypothetical protein